jgi:hypothetical protein
LETAKAVSFELQRTSIPSNQGIKRRLMLYLLSWGLGLSSVAIIAGFNRSTSINTSIIGNRVNISMTTDKSTVINEEYISFECDKYANEVVMIGEIGKARRTIMKFDEKSEWGNIYSPIKRCQMIASKFNKYIRNDRHLAITTGIKNGYDIICISEGVGKGCLKDENNGMLFTLRPSDSHSQQEYLENFIAFEPKEIKDVLTESTIATSSRVYIDLYKFIQDGRDYYKIYH